MIPVPNCSPFVWISKLIRAISIGRFPVAGLNGFSLLMLVVLVSFEIGVLESNADITLPQVFSDNMVLQRNSKIRFYGTADPNQKLKIQFRDFNVEVTADQQGVWSTNLPTGGAGGPFKLTVTAVEGQPTVQLANVMVGEVWLCAGQSNMKWPVSKVLNSKTEIEQSINYPNLRLFTILENPSRQPLSRLNRVKGWDVCSPDSVGEFSGTAYFFGRELSKKFPNMPIGLINVSAGGTPIEAWISRQQLVSAKKFDAMLEYWDGVDSENDNNRPAVLFNGMISPLKSLKLRGVVWYQGEQNVGRGDQYRDLMKSLIVDWRDFLQNEKLPFYFVQLAPFRYQTKPTHGLPEVWDAQLETLRNVPGTGMVVTTDIGDIESMHPVNKQEVGRRLALIAQGNVYQDQLPDGEKVTFSGPIFCGNVKTEGDKMVIKFDHDRGLRIRGKDQALTCFAICGEDRKFVPAVATLVGNSVHVSAEGISNPVAVRFGWTDTAQPNLENDAGLPAAPFRTDRFPLQSKGKEF